jgi:hypothetical protein
MAYSGLTFLSARERSTPDREASRPRREMRMGVCQAWRQALQSGEPVVAPPRAEINELLDLPMYCELEARTVEKCLKTRAEC